MQEYIKLQTYRNAFQWSRDGGIFILLHIETAPPRTMPILTICPFSFATETTQKTTETIFEPFFKNRSLQYLLDQKYIDSWLKAIKLKLVWNKFTGILGTLSNISDGAFSETAFSC